MEQIHTLKSSELMTRYGIESTPTMEVIDSDILHKFKPEARIYELLRDMFLTSRN